MFSTFDKIQKILSEKFRFHFDQIELQTELENQLGMDSREMLEFLIELEKVFKIKINLDDVDRLIQKNDILTIQNIVDYLEKNQIKNIVSN
jgi:acyl carrier protein